MTVAKRRGKEKPAKIEQRSKEGPRIENGSEDFRWNQQHSWLAQLTQGGPRGGENM